MATRSAPFARPHMSILVACLGLASPCLAAMEKDWIAHKAQTIVVGTFRPSPTWPWFDGWHMNGVITVHEVLFGGRIPAQLKFQYVCRWDWPCQRWPPPLYPDMIKQKGIWFLRHVDGINYESSIHPWFGLADLSERAYWEGYIRRNKSPRGTRLDAATPATAVRPSK